MSKKQLLADLIDKVLPDAVLPSFNGSFVRKLTVLAYHRVCNEDKKRFFFDYELVSANSDDFEFQVQYAKKYFNPITMELLLEHIAGNAELPDRPILITFDDGFEDNYSIAFPILKKYQVPATIFISTDYIDTDKTIWFDKLAAYILNMAPGKLVIDELNKTYQLDDNIESRREVAFDLLCAIKRIPNQTRLEVLSELFAKVDSGLASIDYQQSKMMSWEQIAEMKQSGISFGSHTRSHPILTMLNDNELTEELLGSKQVIEKELNEKVDSISYPNGGVDDFSDEVLLKTEKSGYKIGFSYIGGVNNLPLINKYTLKRLHVEHYVTRSLFKALLCLPSLFSDQ